MQPLAIREPAVMWFLLRTITTLKLSFSAETGVKRFARLMHIPDEIRGSGSPAESAAMGRGIARLKVPTKDHAGARAPGCNGRRAGGPLGLFLPRGPGGDGGEGGYGGPGRGGDSIVIAYLDEDRLTVEGVTSTLGPPGKGGISWDDQGKMISGEDGVAVETLR
ncbi:hypothetical protein WME79_12480 [Sorangium sp. So ce726]|uniref:hypothetical protein n=1 Tax=Sorangium sp. So ce726 TaxID=3133319 RepID=UPI003F5DEBE8